MCTGRNCEQPPSRPPTPITMFDYTLCIIILVSVLCIFIKNKGT